MPPRHRSRQLRLVAGPVVAALAIVGLTDLSAAPGASAAAADGPCSYGGYQGGATVSVDGAPTVGAPVTATFRSGSDWTSGVRAGDLSYTWSGTGFGDPVRGAAFTARPDLVGADVHLTVRARNDSGTVGFTATCSLPRVTWGSLARPSAPTVTGPRELGGTLTATRGAGDAAAEDAHHYEWFAGDDPSAFAIGSSVVLGRDQVGQRITVKTMVTSLGSRDSAWSEPTVTDPVAGDTLATPAAPSIAGDAVMAGVLTATAAPGGDLPADATYDFRWLADGTPFATGGSLTLAAAQVGTTITAQARVMAAGYAASEWSTASAPTAVVAPGVLTTPASITLTGTPRVGDTIAAAVDGSWTPGTAVTFTWKADGVPFSNAAGSVQLAPAQLGARISLQVTGSLAGYTGGSIESAPTEPVSGAATGGGPVGGGPVPGPSSVGITGTVQVGKRLTATSVGGWQPGASVSWVWKADGVAFATGTPSVVLAPAQVGRRITVEATGTLADYDPTTVVSAATGTVKPGKLSGATPRISGTARVGHRLTVHLGRWPDGTDLTVRWYADGRLLKGESGQRLKLTRGLRGDRITVRVSGSLDGYATETRRSKPTTRVR